MLVEIDFESTQALYMQLHDQIIIQIAEAILNEGDQLPSVRSMAEEIGINMHTVNKAYALLRDEGFLHLDQRRGAVISIDEKKSSDPEDVRQDLRFIAAQAVLRGMKREEMHELIDRIYDDFDVRRQKKKEEI